MSLKKYISYFLKYYEKFGKKELVDMIIDNYSINELCLICRNLNIRIKNNNNKEYNEKTYYVQKIINYLDYLKLSKVKVDYKKNQKKTNQVKKFEFI